MGDRRRGLSVSRAALMIGVPARTLRSWLPLDGLAWRATESSPWQIDPRFVRDYCATRSAVDEIEAAFDAKVGNGRQESAEVGNHVDDASDDAA